MEQQNISMNYTCLRGPISLSICAHVSLCPRTNTHGWIHTWKLYFPPADFSFHFFLFFFLLPSIFAGFFFFFFWYFKAGSSWNGWNCHISVLAKEINANPITGSYHLPQNSQLKEKNTLRCQSKKKRGVLGRRRVPFIHFQIVIVFSLYFLIIFFFPSCLAEKPNYKTPVLTQQYGSDLKPRVRVGALI